MRVLAPLACSPCLAQQVPLHIPFYDTSANGFTSPARGWNSFGLQAASAKLQHAAGWSFNDYHFRQQCGRLVFPQSGHGDNYYCSIDSGWSVGCNGDAHGIPYPDLAVLPNISNLATHLRGNGIKLGIYVLPGAFGGDSKKMVKGTNITIGSLFSQSDPAFNCRRNFDYTKDGVQQWHDSVVAQFLEWGVALIKLDYVTPGSPQAGETLPADSSGAVTAYHTAIKNSGAVGRMRLHISWKLDRREPHGSVWRAGADSLRLDQDVNNAGKDTLCAWKTVLRTVEAYRVFANENVAAVASGPRRGLPIRVRRWHRARGQPLICAARAPMRTNQCTMRPAARAHARMPDCANACDRTLKRTAGRPTHQPPRPRALPCRCARTWTARSLATRRRSRA
jgi:alpha-galactosidase